MLGSISLLNIGKGFTFASFAVSSLYYTILIFSDEKKGKISIGIPRYKETFSIFTVLQKQTCIQGHFNHYFPSELAIVITKLWT